ncbi:hypothetical protein AVEN_166783-1 [Araneus ventricosus]|uniref:Uncharacterized protein n=1 Tax=Araneus ventricosus TaxID=182803 RepID=A0A4Y2BRC3_ARAVE|nr:hypothetical protein AVEN_166783-1 [Araneus ventricosus]
MHILLLLRVNNLFNHNYKLFRTLQFGTVVAEFRPRDLRLTASRQAFTKDPGHIGLVVEYRLHDRTGRLETRFYKRSALHANPEWYAEGQKYSPWCGAKVCERRMPAYLLFLASYYGSKYYREMIGRFQVQNPIYTKQPSVR